jgi:hypothetical protein
VRLNGGDGSMKLIDGKATRIADTIIQALIIACLVFVIFAMAQQACGS